VKCHRHRSYILASCSSCTEHLKERIKVRRDGGAGRLTLVRVSQEESRATSGNVSLAS
jgi:hypothetical protein